MEAADELLTISELAIALAGFSGVVAAFGHSNGIGRSQRFYFIALVIVALSTVILAFVPFLLHSGGVMVWLILSGMTFVYMVVHGSTLDD
jgi:hypothetical protein